MMDKIIAVLIALGIAPALADQYYVQPPQPGQFPNLSTGIGSGVMRPPFAGTRDTFLGITDACTDGSTSCDFNTTFGWHAGENLVGGAQFNTLIGDSAGLSVGSGFSNNTMIGFSACSAANQAANTCIGANTGTTLATGANNILIGNGVDVPTASTSNRLNIGNVYLGDIAHAHQFYQGLAPAVSACGTSPAIDGNATDSSGTVTVGSTATTCTVTFNVAYGTFDHCSVSAHTTTAAFAYSYSLSAITVTATALGGIVFDFRCDGH